MTMGNSYAEVSIHAPVRRRHHRPLQLLSRRRFNPRPRKEATEGRDYTELTVQFQSTPP